jgi:hypothetical protein
MNTIKALSLSATLILFTSAVIAAPTTPPATAIVWNERFDDATTFGDLVDDAEKHEAISGGFFELTSKMKDPNSGASDIREFNIDRNKEYALEADMQVKGLTEQSYCGLFWDFLDDNNFYTFLVFPSGFFTIMRSKNGVVALLANHEASAAIKKGASMNRLRVSKVGSSLGSSLNFVVNGTLVKTMPYEGCGGNYSGFIVSGGETARVDSLTYIAPKDYEGEKLGRQFGDKAVYETSFRKGSDSWITSSDAVEGRFEEPGLDAGGYALEHRDPATYGILSKDFAFDLKKDFSIEARLHKVSKDNDYGYGVAVDRKGDDYLYFRLTGSGFYTIGRRVSGKDNAIVEWTPQTNVNKYESSNLLGIYRQGAKLYFCLNGRKVFEQEYKAWSSTEAGFVLGGETKVRLESMGVYTY